MPTDNSVCSQSGSNLQVKIHHAAARPVSGCSKTRSSFSASDSPFSSVRRNSIVHQPPSIGPTPPPATPRSLFDPPVFNIGAAVSAALMATDTLSFNPPTQGMLDLDVSFCSDDVLDRHSLLKRPLSQSSSSLLPSLPPLSRSACPSCPGSARASPVARMDPEPDFDDLGLFNRHSIDLGLGTGTKSQDQSLLLSQSSVQVEKDALPPPIWMTQSLSLSSQTMNTQSLLNFEDELNTDEVML